MDHQRISEQLKALPPELPSAPDRIERVQAKVQQKRRNRAVLVGGAVVVVSGLVTSVAVSTDGASQTVRRDSVASGPASAAPGIAPTTAIPGADVVTRLDTAADVRRTGTATVDFGQAPSRANAVELKLSCLSATTFSFTDGASISCYKSDGETSRGYVLPLDSGQTQVTIATEPTASWRLVAFYVRKTITEWAVNDAGQTYGARNENGAPDLLAVRADNGVAGYALTTSLEAAEFSDEIEVRAIEIPVYEPDGRTRIGTYTTGPFTAEGGS